MILNEQSENIGRTPAEIMTYVASMSALRENRHYPGRIIIPLRDKFVPISVSEICYIYSTNRQTEIVLKDSQKYSVNKSLEQLQSTLDPEKFRRANKQFIISKDAIKELVAWFDSRLLIKMGVETPEDLFVSKNSASEFKKWLTH